MVCSTEYEPQVSMHDLQQKTRAMGWKNKRDPQILKYLLLP